MDDDLSKVITDSSIKLRNHIYHFECQSNPDSSMIIRMIEYDFHIALEHTKRENDTYVMDFPYSAVLYLRHTSKTPEQLNMKVNFPNGQYLTYKLPIIKVQNLSCDEILKKNLFFLIPYYIMRYENTSLNQPEVINDLRSSFQQLEQGLSLALQSNMITDYDMTNINDLTLQLTDYLMDYNDHIRKEVKQIMGGQIIETFADKAIKRANEAAEERVKAAEERIKKEAEELVKASEERIKASEERIKASEERIKASEERIKASEEQTIRMQETCILTLHSNGIDSSKIAVQLNTSIDFVNKTINDAARKNSLNKKPHRSGR